MAQVQTMEAGVVVAFRPPLLRSKKTDARPAETGTVLLFTGTRYERVRDEVDATPAGPAEADPAHS